MAAFTARLVHPDGPHSFPEDPNEDRDYSRDPRSVYTLADSLDEAKTVLLADNPEFVFHTGPDEVAE